MKTIKLHHPTGHPYWQRNNFKVELPNGEFADTYKFSAYNGKYGEEVEVYVEPEGIYVQYFMCSSGTGKWPYGERHLLIPGAEYDNIEYIGEPLTMSKTLIDDLIKNDISP